MSVFQQFLQTYKIANTNVYAIPMSIFKSLDVKFWKHNRPPTLSRVPEIHNWMAEFHRMDGVLNLAHIPGEGLVCFEGNHRRLALEGLDITVLVDIVWNATHATVKQEFKRLNQSISVPDLYVVENDATIRLNIENAVAEFRKKYSKHESSHGRFQRPNFNRDKLTDELFRLQNELMVSVDDLMIRIYEQNDKLALADKTKLSENTIKKCSESGLWLFAWSQNINLT